MQLSEQALTVMAECISRNEHVTVETNGVAEENVWCEECQAHNAVTFLLRGITDQGVYDCGTVTACPIHDDTESTDE